MITEIKSAREHHRQSHRALYELNANYSASPEEFTKILDELNNDRMRSAAKFSDRFKMKSLLTAEEWTALSEELKVRQPLLREGFGGHVRSLRIRCHSGEPVGTGAMIEKQQVRRGLGQFESGSPRDRCVHGAGHAGRVGGNGRAVPE